ncbi:MAG TPA: ATP-binding protein, partial [Candidatus Saccharimonadia bacterium]|nr:ATP-binding protein [Candidatus Saccharimonadia bacterium]
DDTLTARAQAIIVATEVNGRRLDLDDDLVAFAGFGEGNPRDFFALYQADGARVLRSSSLPLGSLDFIKQEILQAAQQPDLLFATLRDGRAVRVRVQAFIPSGSEGGSFHDLRLVTGTETRGLQETLRTLATVLTGTGFLFFLATIVALREALRRGLRPLDHLAGQIRAIQPGNHDSLHLPHALPDELVPVVEKLNELLKRVDDSLARERRFSSHAAHELRTPLAELRATAELAATWPEEATPERLRDMLQVIGNLDELVERLGQLARMDGGGQAAQLEPVDLQETIRIAVQRHQEAADARRVTLETHITPGAFRTDPTLWNSILNNLIGNAINHAPEGVAVRVTASPARLCVSNPAPDLHAGDVPHLFERFWRKHSASGAEHHSGLGLSIVAVCVETLGGRVRASFDSGTKVLSIEVDLVRQPISHGPLTSAF